jgi:hypothetical protein
MPQLNHTTDMPIARAGLVADLRHVDVISRLAEDAAGAGAGLFVVQGTDAEKQAIAPTTTDEVTSGVGLGVVMLDTSKEPAKVAAAITAGNEYDVEDSLPIVTKGPIWMRCDDAAVITAGLPVFVRFAQLTTPTGVLGAAREDADTADAVALPGARFLTAHKDVSFDGDTQRIALVDLNPTL